MTWLRIQLGNLIVISGMVVIAAGGATYARVQSDRIERVAEESHVALCAFKIDLERRVANGEQFLQENPEGIPGISREDIQRSIDAQKSTLISLSALDCS